MIEYEPTTKSVSAGLDLVRKAADAVERRQYTDRAGSEWRLDRDFSDTPEYVGSHGKAQLYYTSDGQAYEVCTFDYTGRTLHAPVRRKGLDAAFRTGQRLADTPSGGTDA